ncbi:hypothetical protein IJS64_04435, partial [bacterium]|nr:hypothetical protein [bacterium]
NTLFSFLFSPLLNLGEFSRKRKGGFPLKMHLGNFVRNLPFYFFCLLFVFQINKNNTDELACALYFFLFRDTSKYLGKNKRLYTGAC